MNKGAFVYGKNHGRRTIGIKERMDAIGWLNEFAPCTFAEKRAKTILELFLKENLSAQAICRLNHPDIVSIGNRSKGKPLCTAAILSVIYDYFPQFKNRRGKSGNSARIELMRKREKTNSPHIKACAHCGGEEDLEEHHMIPLFMGGSNEDENLIYLCKSCHQAVTLYQRRMMQRCGIRG